MIFSLQFHIFALDPNYCSFLKIGALFWMEALFLEKYKHDIFLYCLDEISLKILFT